MGKQKGQPKTGGREKGTPNKVTADLRTWLSELWNENREQFKDDLKALEPHQRVASFEKLLNYIIPKQQSVEATIESIDLRSLSEEQLNLIISRITNDLSDES
jgi:hypothetical protein